MKTKIAWQLIATLLMCILAVPITVSGGGCETTPQSQAVTGSPIYNAARAGTEGYAAQKGRNMAGTQPETVVNVNVPPNQTANQNPRFFDGRLSDGAYYKGEMYNNVPHGFGIYTWPSGEKYVGDFFNGQRQGQGTNTWPNGQKYVGEWVNGTMSGQGAYTWPDGKKYVGEFVNGTVSGQGTMTWPDGRKYVGEWVNGKANGQGTDIYADGTKRVGEFVNGEFVGNR